MVFLPRIVRVPTALTAAAVLLLVGGGVANAHPIQPTANSSVSLSTSLKTAGQSPSGIRALEVPLASMDSPDTLAVDASILKFSRDGSRAFVYGSQYFADIYAPADMVSGSVEVMNAFDLAMSPSGSTAYLPTSY